MSVERYDPFGVPEDAIQIGELVRAEWLTADHWMHNGFKHDGPCTPDMRHLVVWHDCGRVLGPDSVQPGARYGWAPAGCGSHDLVRVTPLDLDPSVFWPDCCGLHGWIRSGIWVGA